jgi:hypothetical protein
LSGSDCEECVSEPEVKENREECRDTTVVIKQYKDKINSLYLKNNQLKARIQAMEIEKMV